MMRLAYRRCMDNETERSRTQRIFAHSLPGQDKAQWEPLAAHLCRVGVHASKLAAKFDAGNAALAAGVLHDIGKVSAAFQAYINSAGPSPDHSSAGAVEAVRLFPGPMGRLIAFAIAGHHAGLADGAGSGNSLDARLARHADLPNYQGWRSFVSDLPADVSPRLTGVPRDLGYTLS